jgi:hypothetical protein
VPEGLSQQEVTQEVAHHPTHDTDGSKHDTRGHQHLEWILPAIEATLLAIVAVLAAWSGYSSAKWNTDSRLQIAKASTARTQASTAELLDLSQKNFDSSTFTVWFVAYDSGEPTKMLVAERRFTPNFRRAFDAWMMTRPFTNPHAAPGPTYMPQYRQPELALANRLNTRADLLYASGSAAGSHGDDYVLLTIYLATVLFLVAISGQFRVRPVRIGIIGLSGVVLVVALVHLTTLPAPPS